MVISNGFDFHLNGVDALNSKMPAKAFRKGHMGVEWVTFLDMASAWPLTDCKHILYASVIFRKVHCC